MSRIRLSALAVLTVAAMPLPGQGVELVSKAHPSLFSDAARGEDVATSADGRYVAFTATGNAIAGQSGASAFNLYLLDRVAGTVVLVSHVPGSPNQAANASTFGPASLSADGRYLAFASRATDLVGGSDANSGSDVFLFDRLTGVVTLASHALGAPTTAGNGRAVAAAISADGNWVAFTSEATNHVAGVDVNGGDDVFLFERATGLIGLASHVPGQPGVAANGLSWAPTLSADGGRVGFTSGASDLVPAGDSNGDLDVFVFERATGLVRLVSRVNGTPSTTGNGESSDPQLSTDGLWLAFVSEATDLVVGTDANGAAPDVFLADTASGLVTLVSHAVSTPGVAGDLGSSEPSIGADGAWVAFTSSATNLVAPADANALPDVYVYERSTGTNRLASHAASGTQLPANGSSFKPALSAGGACVAFFSTATNLVPGSDLNSAPDLFVFERGSGQVRLVSHAFAVPGQAGNWAQAPASPALPSADCASIAYSSVAEDLTALQDTNQAPDAFAWQAASGANALLSRRLGDPSGSGSGSASSAAVSADGRFVAFLDDASNLAPGQVDINRARDVFLLDRQGGTMTLASHVPGQPERAGDGEATEVSLSDDGRWVAFASTATDLVEGDGNDASDVFLFDRLTGGVRLVSHEHGASWKSAAGTSHQARLSGDGRRLVFTSQAPNLVAGDGNGVSDVYLHDLATGATVVASHAVGAPGVTANGQSSLAIPSADGQFVTFASGASNLVVGSDPSSTSDVFRYSVGTGQNELVSHRFGEPGVAAGASAPVGISLDGSVVAFLSAAPDLVSSVPVGNFTLQAYVYDAPSGLVQLASHVYSSPTLPGDLFVQQAALSGDGRWLAFVTGSDLLPPPAGGSRDTYLFDRLGGALQLVDHVPGAPMTGGNSGTYNGLGIDGTGSLVVFRSFATDLVAGGSGYVGTNVFGYLRATGEVRLLSHVPGNPLRAGNGESALFGPAVVSLDGSAVAFLSQAPDLVGGDYNGTQDLFLAIPGPVPVELSSFSIE